MCGESAGRPGGGEGDGWDGLTRGGDGKEKTSGVLLYRCKNLAMKFKLKTKDGQQLRKLQTPAM